MKPEDCETDLALLCSALRRLFAEPASDAVSYAEGGVALHLQLVAVGVARVAFQERGFVQSAHVDFLRSTLWLESDPTGSLLRTELSSNLGAASGAALCELVHGHARRLIPVAALTAARRGLRGGSGTRPKVSLTPAKVGRA
ncbi:MAG: hypothetical protein AB7K71_03780 [Polyangiaceae bacterium]